MLTCYNGGMSKPFTAQVHKIIARNSALMELVAKESVQRLIQTAQTPKAKGGKLPLDTGFLRASGRTSYTGMPSGPTRGVAAETGKRKLKGKAAKAQAEARQTYTSPDTVNIAGFKLGATIFFGWTAFYARKQNLYNGFLDSAVKNWQKIVDGTIRDLRKRL